MRFLFSWTLWNLMLAAAPVVLGYSLARGLSRVSGREGFLRWVGLATLAAVWLAFVPNTCYLFTEWRHFLERVDGGNIAMKAMDDQRQLLRIAGPALFYMCYSGFGAITLTLAIRPIERSLRRRGVPFCVVAIPLFILIAVGVYLGLVLRFNSWDLWTRPMEVLASASAVVRYPVLFVTVMLFAAMLWVLYEALDLWLDGVLRRVQMLLRRHWPEAAPIIAGA